MNLQTPVQIDRQKTILQQRWSLSVQARRIFRDCSGTIMAPVFQNYSYARMWAINSCEVQKIRPALWNY